jgi:hypothetical protein
MPAGMAMVRLMPHFLLTFVDAGRPVTVVIMEAPSMFQARMNAVVQRFAPGVPFGNGYELSAKMMAAIPPIKIGRIMSGPEARWSDGDDPTSMYLTSHFGFAAVASGNDLESNVIAFNRNTGMPRQKGAQTIARPITTSINPPKKTLKIRA